MIVVMPRDRASARTEAPADSPPPSDRRARRRLETIEEILDIATEVMNEEGVNGLSLAEVARRLGVQPPSLYKYFPSLMAVYDRAVFFAANGNILPSCVGPWPRPIPDSIP